MCDGDEALDPRALDAGLEGLPSTAAVALSVEITNPLTGTNARKATENDALEEEREEVKERACDVVNGESIGRIDTEQDAPQCRARAAVSVGGWDGGNGRKSDTLPRGGDVTGGGGGGGGQGGEGGSEGGGRGSTLRERIEVDSSDDDESVCDSTMGISFSHRLQVCV